MKVEALRYSEAWDQDMSEYLTARAHRDSYDRIAIEKKIHLSKLWASMTFLEALKAGELAPTICTAARQLGFRSFLNLYLWEAIQTIIQTFGPMTRGELLNHLKAADFPLPSRTARVQVWTAIKQHPEVFKVKHDFINITTGVFE